MCSNLDDLSEIEQKILRAKEKIASCKKCETGTPFVLIHKEHSYCQSCFHEHVSHKFRSTIGKSKLVKKGNRILVAVSGGAASSAMLQLMKDGLSLDNHHRRLQFVPSLLHIDETVLSPESDAEPIQQMRDTICSHGFDYYVTSIAKSFRRSGAPFFSKNDAAVAEDFESQKLISTLAAIHSATSKEEFVRRLRIHLIVDIAVAEKFDAIFLGSSGSRLSIQLITDVAQGKGNQIDQETGFVDDRFPVPILKPMREFVSKEVHFFLKMRNMPIATTSDILTKADTRSSLSKVTESFINSLESDFPSTTYSLCRIATKIRPKQCVSDKASVVCPLCHSLNDRTDVPDCSALSALTITRTLCNSSSLTPETEFERRLCFSCSQIMRESNCISEEVQDLCSMRSVRRAEIAEFLIDEDE